MTLCDSCTEQFSAARAQGVGWAGRDGRVHFTGGGQGWLIKELVESMGGRDSIL